MSKSDSNVVVSGRGLTRTYHQGEVEVHALQGVDIDIRKGEFSALAGPSGSGKSTLLNLIGALDTASSGTLELSGRPLAGMSRTAAAHFRLAHIGFIFQAYNLVPVLTAYENAEFTLYLKGVSADKRRELVMPLLERVGLGGLEDRRPHEMSGGQQQRVAVVRAIAPRPAIVLADEPTANLDSQSASELLDLMEELNADHGSTFLFASHDPQVLHRARRVVRLLDGEVESDIWNEDANDAPTGAETGADAHLLTTPPPERPKQEGAA